MSSVSTEKSIASVSTREKVLLAVLLVLLLLAYHQLFTSETPADVVPDIVEAFFSVSGISTQFLYVLVVGLLFIRRDDIAVAYKYKGEAWSAMLYLVPGVCLFLWGMFVSALDLVHVSFVLVVFGLARFMSGRQLTRLLVPPSLILLLGTPLPAVLLNQIIFPLQLWDTIHSVWLLNVIGFPASAQGDMIVMAETSTRFAETCTALGFILWLTIFALAYVYIFRITRWHAVLLVLSAPLIAYLVNLLRAFTLVLNPAMEILTIHTLQGVVFFLIGFSFLYAVDSVLLRLSPDKEESKVKDDLAMPDRADSPCLMLPLCVLSALAVSSFLIPRWEVPREESYSPVSLPDRVGGWQHVYTPAVKYSFLGSVRYSASAYRDYSSAQGLVSVFVGEDDRLRRHRSLLSGKNAYPDGIGVERDSFEIDLGPEIGNAVVKILDNGQHQLIAYHWYEGVSSVSNEILYAFLALDQSPFRREERARVTRLVTYIDQSDDGQTLAENRLRAFLEQMQETQK